MTLTDAHYVALGRVAVEFARLEDLVSNYAAVIVSVRDGKAADYSRFDKMPFEKKLDILRRAYNAIGLAGQDAPRFDAAIDAVRLVGYDRNALFHATWVQVPADPSHEARVVRFIKGRNDDTGKVFIKPTTPADIDAVRERIASAVQLVVPWFDVAFAKLHQLTPDGPWTLRD